MLLAPHQVTILKFVPLNYCFILFSFDFPSLAFTCAHFIHSSLRLQDVCIFTYVFRNLQVYGRTFVLDDCDEFVLKFISQNAHMYPQEVLDALSEKYTLLFNTE